MKARLITLLSLFTAVAFAHEGVELGPNKGRILEFSKNETMHGEVIVKGDKFHIALLDKDKKPVAMDKQTLTATTGERDKPVKLAVEKDAKGFVVPVVKAGEWLILQYKNSPDAKAVTARLEYNTSTCEECKKAEWLCECKPAAEKK
ncbi:hypothetical protein [Prosthecobacter sp.]|uniref:hypothetical protein n=1 Tax=Prosthecobacter sp. TaxID=1965333 RepID=UPI002ABC3C8A|nr:hypothetical protein [Prosthecobacter sp.]MDZ4405539.1 hypothetical protein [Prosthecobacter sp.]